jgi:hypothetical protein
MKQIKTTSLKKGGKEDLLAEPPMTLLQVDLWTDTHPSDVSSARSGEINVLPSALAMVGDLLRVAGGEIRNSSTTSLSASFRETVQAVNAARRMQRLVRGFSRASVEGPLYACFILTSLQDADSGTDADLLNCIDAVKQAQPGEVLFVGSICEAAKSIPGLQFEVPAGSPKTGDSDTPQRTILQLLPPIHMEGYIDEPVEAVVRMDVKKPPTTIVSTPIGQLSVSSELSPAPKREVASAVAVPAVTSISAAGDETGASFNINRSLPLKINPRWAIAGVSGVALVASLLIFSPILKNSSRPPQNQSFPAPSSSAPSSSEKSDAPPPVPQSNGEPQLTTKTPASPSAKQNESGHARTGKEQSPEEFRPAPVRGGQHGVTFTPAEIDLLIARADKDTGDGNYDRAIQEYTTVLNQDPSNALAKKGLAKAVRNKSHS